MQFTAKIGHGYRFKVGWKCLSCFCSSALINTLLTTEQYQFVVAVHLSLCISIKPISYKSVVPSVKKCFNKYNLESIKKPAKSSNAIWPPRSQELVVRGWVTLSVTFQDHNMAFIKIRQNKRGLKKQGEIIKVKSKMRLWKVFWSAHLPAVDHHLVTF